MRLRHGRTDLELHELSLRDGPGLLLLHALGGSSADWSETAVAWPGRVFALDFCGHGRSGHLRGGGYMPELLAADADMALAAIGPAAVAGAGVGAYVALLLAGGRRDAVPAALLLAGRGLAGGGPYPRADQPLLGMFTPAAHDALPAGCDPLLCALDTDVRPPEYAIHYATAARCVLLHEDGGTRPPWWDAVRHVPGTRAITGDVPSALHRLAAGC